MSELIGIARFKIHEGKLDEFKRLSAQAMEVVRTKDRGTLQYDTYFNDDRSECVVVERYKDSQAAIEHAANLADLSEAVLGTVSVVTAKGDWEIVSVNALGDEVFATPVPADDKLYIRTHSALYAFSENR